MSESEPDARAWSFYVDDMIGFARKAVGYAQGFEFTSFIADQRTYDATLRNLELLGEAATRVPPSIREQHQGIPWRQMIATRN